jgi:regulator of cell morphogenesis and NO signaling
MLSATQSIREILSSQPGAAAILQRFDIDPYARADESLVETCTDLQLSIEQVLEKLEERADPTAFTPSRLIQHIVRIHHRNVRQRLPQLLELAHSAAQEHHDRFKELEQVEVLLQELHLELQEHVRKEEGVLFPYIAQMDEAPLIAFRPPLACFSRVGQPVFVMAQEHEHVSLLLAELRRLTDEYQAPEWASPGLMALYAGLREFSNNLNEHIRLENDVLFPRAIAMEAELMGEGA